MQARAEKLTRVLPEEVRGALRGVNGTLICVGGAGTGNHRAGRALPAFTKGALRPLHHTHERRPLRRCAGDDDAQGHRQALDGI